jgi:hypothetical protein
MPERRIGRGPSAKMEHLFNAIGQGKTYSEIHEGANSRSPVGAETSRRGIDSETRARRLIGRLPYVKEINTSQKNSAWDRQGIDFVVQFWQSRKITIDQVSVQIKSSKARVTDFKRRLMREHGLQNFAELNAWLKEQQFVILNGRKTDAEILTDFERQIRDIQESA